MTFYECIVNGPACDGTMNEIMRITGWLGFAAVGIGVPIVLGIRGISFIYDLVQKYYEIHRAVTSKKKSGAKRR